MKTGRPLGFHVTFLVAAGLYGIAGATLALESRQVKQPQPNPSPVALEPG